MEPPANPARFNPVGRTTSYAYANQIDLSAISQTTAYGVQTTIAQFIYNTHHQPIYSTDAAGQTTSYTYNAAGQLTSVTNPLNQTTTYQYDALDNLTTIINANGATAASFTYDTFDRIATSTDSEGWTVAYTYDNANRITKRTFPDGTTDTYTYSNLDLASYQDRLGRVWTYTHDADRRLTQNTDPNGHQTLFGYNGNNELTSLTDANGNVTSWAYDVEGRLTQKTYADSSTATNTYENTTSRLHAVLDALGQTKQYSYAEDNRLTGIAYLGAVNPTPNVSFAYDPYFPRRVSMTDGTGTTQYSYVPVGSLGALHRQQEASPLAGSAITYAYDALGRMTSRTVAGQGTETFGFDAIGRLTSHSSDLGAFALSYLGQTGQITGRALSGSTLTTTWSYLPNSGDRRLAGIANIGLSTSQYSNYAYTTVPDNGITGSTESSDASAVYPAVGAQTAAYNDLNQLTTLSGHALTFDADGNLLSDGTRTYAWDAENRLVGITYPGSSGKATAFIYDGLSRRTAIASTPTGGSGTVTTSYVWCGSSLCQARNTANATTREYFGEGELVPGTSPQPYYYGTDQIGSVRRVFASASSAPAYGYDPYGNALQAAVPVTDFNYARMFYNADSGLYLSQFRAYDPGAGRWLSRDPMGESSDVSGNLYAYVGGNPINETDPSGKFGIVGAGVGAAVGGLGDVAYQLYNNGGNAGCINWGQVAGAAGVGALVGSGAEFILGLVGETAAAEGGVAAEGVEGASSFFEGTQYTSKVLQQMEGGVGEFHSFPESVTAFEDSGSVSTITGGDGAQYQMLRIPGSYQSTGGTWYEGEFQFIQDSDGFINHRLFVPTTPVGP